MSILPNQVRDLIKEARFYVVFQDGSWRTATDEQWKSEQLWKLRPKRTFWFGGPEALDALEMVWGRYLDSKPEENP